MNIRLLTVFAATLGLSLLSNIAVAQSFPTQAVRFISPFPAGSGPDVVERIVGEKMSAAWKQPVIVDPRPGANGFIAAIAVKQAAPTGYDLMVADVGHLTINPSLFKKLPYNPMTDFTPVGGLYRAAFFIVVATNSPIKSVKDMAALAQASPGKMTYGSNAIGSPLHLGAAQIEDATSAKMVHVPYKEVSQLYIAVSTGEVDWALGSLASAGPLLKSGKLRIVAVADTVRSPVEPNVPTFQESGGAKPVVVRSWVSLVAPKGTPPATMAILNKSLNDALRQPDVAEKLAPFGFAPFPTTPAELTTLINKETVFYAEVVKRTGATAD